MPQVFQQTLRISDTGAEGKGQEVTAASSEGPGPQGFGSFFVLGYSVYGKPSSADRSQDSEPDRALAPPRSSPGRLERHLQAVPGAQGDQGIRLDAMPGDQAGTIFLRDGSKDQIRFSQRKDVSDALARTAAERKVGVAREAGGALSRKPLGLEALGILPELRMPMRHPLAEHHVAAARYPVPHYLVVFDRSASDRPHRGDKFASLRR